MTAEGLVSRRALLKGAGALAAGYALAGAAQSPRASGNPNGKSLPTWSPFDTEQIGLLKTLQK